MIATRDQAQVTSTLPGETHRMGIDQANVQHIMSVLTDMYSDPEMAVLREYLTNAHDSHTQAGTTRPVELKLPSSMDPLLTVQDWGVGLSATDIRDLYSRYGASTKRDTNEQTGMLGIGCKSALTYTDQFTLVGVKDGERCQVSIGRDEDGAGSMTVVSVEPTDEPNGVTVMVPTKRANEFATKAEQLLKYWPEGTVLVNGEPPARVDGQWLSGTVLLAKQENPNEWRHRSMNMREHIVVMGNVPYPVEITDEAHKRMGLTGEYQLVTWVPIGSVHFTPSREALQFTTTTKRTLEGVHKQVVDTLAASAQAEVDTAASKAEALQVMNRWRDVTTASLGLTFQGKDVPESLEYPHTHVKVNEARLAPRGGKGAHSAYEEITSDQWPTTLWVHGYTYSFNGTHKDRLMAFLDKRHIRDSVAQFTLAEHPPVSDWLDSSRIVHWKDNVLAETRDPVVQGTASGRATADNPEYKCAKEPYPGKLKASEIKARGVPVYWTHSAGVYRAHPLMQPCVIVQLPDTRVKKFKRLFPEAQSLKAAVTAKVTKHDAALTDEQRRRKSLTEPDHHKLIGLDPTKINDPKLAEWVRIAHMKSPRETEEVRQLRRLYSVTEAGPEESAPLTGYPLLDNQSWYNMKGEQLKHHLYLYINAVHAHNKEDSA